MNIYIIEQYLKRYTKTDLQLFLTSQNINIPEKDLDTLYKHLQQDTKYFLEGHHQEILTTLKKEVEPKTYSYLQEYYNKYKDKLNF